MNNGPMGFEEQMILNHWNLNPSSVHGTHNTTTEYYKRYLYSLISSVFEFDIPWSKNWFRFFLFRCGSIGVIYTNKFGWIAQPYSITQLNLEYQPLEIQVTNQFLEEPVKGIIGLNAEVVNCMDDFFGLDDIVTRTAEMLAQFDKTINVNLMNVSVTKGFEAENKKQADTIKEAYERATTGEPFIVVNKEVMNGSSITNLLGPAGTEYIVDKLLTDRRQCLNSFLTTIGIRNANYSKKERLNSQEVSENNDETKAIVTVMLENIQKHFDTINKMDPSLNLAVRLRFDYTMPGEEGEEESEWEE